MLAVTSWGRIIEVFSILSRSGIELDGTAAISVWELGQAHSISNPLQLPQGRLHADVGRDVAAARRERAG